MQSPHHVAITMLIHVYVCENDDSTWFRRKVRSVDLNRKEANALLNFLLDEVSRNETRSYARLRSEMTNRKVCEALHEGLTSIQSVDDLVSFLEDSDQLLVRPSLQSGSTIRPDHVAKESALGIYIRRFVLESRKRSFWCISKLFEQVREYVSKTKADENDDSTPLSKMSRLQLQRYLQRKILSTEKRMGTGNHHPGVTESEIASLLELQPHLPLAYFFRYLNCTASRNFTGAMEALHRYFDYALQFKSSRMRAQKHEKKEKDGAEKEGEEEEDDDDEKKEEKDENENAFCLQYASLNLAILHFRFGQIEEAYTAVQETLRVAQQHVDHRCIARALFWLFHIASAMDGKRALPLLRRCKSQATELGLHSLERLAALNIAEAAVSSGTDSSSFVWSVLQSEDMSKNERKKKKKKSLAESKTGTQKSQHTQQDISIAQSRSLLLRSAVWEVYGNRSLCRESLIEHMFLSGKCDAEAMCSAYCRLALLDDNSRVSSSSSSSSSSHIRSLRMILRTRELFPHAPSVPGLGWPRALCLALFRRSLLRNEWKIAEMASLQLSALSLPPTATIASILSIANEDGVSNEFRSMLSSSDSGGGTSCALFAESCFCAVKLMAARKQWERALRTARVLFKVCKSFGLEIQASSVQCEIGKIILKSSEPATALWPLLRALAMCRRLDHRLESAICEMTMAELHLRLGHTHKAENLMKRNLSVLLQQGDSRIQGIALLRVAEIRIRSSSSNEKQSASRYLSRALSAFVHAEDVTNVQYVLYLQARLYNDMNLFQDRDSASSKWSAVSSYRTRAESRCPDQYRFLNTTEALEKEIGNGNPLVALVS